MWIRLKTPSKTTSESIGAEKVFATRRTQRNGRNRAWARSNAGGACAQGSDPSDGLQERRRQDSVGIENGKVPEEEEDKRNSRAAS